VGLQRRRAHRTFEAVSVRQARVALDHFLTDIGLVVETMASFPAAKKEAA
jgi:hypothetical protein